MKKYRILPLLIFLMLSSAGCSNKLEKYLPANLDSAGSAVFISAHSENEALKILNKDFNLNRLLAEFKPNAVSAAQYNLSGIIIVMAIARFESADDSWGFYSWLTRFGRERTLMGDTEISYAHPYTAGVKGRYAVWFYTPANPGNYFAFYPDQIYSALKNFGADEKRSYHYKILPDENRVINSEFYVKNRDAGGLPVSSAYGAAYQAGRLRSTMYIEVEATEGAMAQRHDFFIKSFLSKKFQVSRYTLAAGGPGAGIFWRDGDSYSVLYRYRWVSIYITDLGDLKYSQQFIRAAYKKMFTVRKEIITDKPRRAIREND